MKKQIIAMLIAMALMVGFIPGSAFALETGVVDKIEFDKIENQIMTQNRTHNFLKNYTLTGDGASDMVAIAMAQLGRTGSQFGYSEAWCANFVSDCAILAGQTDAVPQNGSSTALKKSILTSGGVETTSNPQPGDICFINWNGGSSIQHVEIVYAVSGTTVSTIGGNTGSGDGKVSKHASLSSKYIVAIVRPAYKTNAKATLDINGYLDGVDQGELFNYGTFDVWVNGSLVADNVSDYCAELTVGSSYEITDIQASSIHKYLGLREGSLSGTVGSDGTNVRLQFRTVDYIGDDFYAYIISNATQKCVFNQGDYNVTCLPMVECLEEIWHFERQENGTYKITSMQDGRSMDVSNYGITPGTNVTTVPYSGNTAQKWCIFEEDAGYCFSAVCTPCVLYEDSATTNIQMMDDTGSAAQWFDIYKIPGEYTYDVNGSINGTELSTTEGYGSFDVWVNGQLVADEVTDFAQSLPIGTAYEVRDIKVNDGCSYNGVAGGSLSGVICSSSVWTVLDFTDAQFDSVGEPVGEATLDGWTYVYYPGQVTWYTAKAFCEKMGGHLVTITSEEENELVKSLAGGASVWLGATDIEKEGTWEWMTGEAFEYQNWETSTDEPNNAGNGDEGTENYIQMMGDTGTWNDIYGSALYGFILELEPEKELASGWCGYAQWKLTSDGVLTVFGEGNMKNYGYAGGQPWAAYVDQITTVVVEEGVTAVGSGAFKGLTKLENVELPTGLTKIGEAAFYGCTSLKEIYIPDGIYTIWTYTFKNCTSLSSVRLPKTLIKIDQGAFEHCTALTELFVPTNVQIIGGWSFKGCTRLKTVDLQWADATEIRAGAFKNCTALKNISLPSNIQTLGDSCFYGIGATKFVVPATVTKIVGWCFARSALAEITFEGDAPTIGTGAFNKIALTACYNGGNATWTSDVMLNYGGTVTWKAN